MNIRSCATCAAIVLCAHASPPTLAAQPKFSIEEAKAYALKLCLDTNYERGGMYSPRDLKDESYLTLRNQLSDLNPNADRRLRAFVEASTFNYYLAQVPTKDEEGRGPFNKIFAQCMSFYRGKALSGYLLREAEHQVAPENMPVRVTEIGRAAYSGRAATAEERVCKDWRLSAAQVERFFALSKEYAENPYREFYQVSCSTSGKLESEGKTWAFEIEGGGTAIWKAGNSTRFWGCSASACEPLVILLTDGMEG